MPEDETMKPSVEISMNIIIIAIISLVILIILVLLVTSSMKEERPIGERVIDACAASGMKPLDYEIFTTHDIDYQCIDKNNEVHRYVIN